MSVSSISSGTSLNPTDWRSTVKQGKQDFRQLLGALQSGDVSGAQQAYSAMQQLLPGLQTALQTSADTGNITSAASTLGTDFSALGAALGSGSLSDAQGAVAKLQQDVQAYRQGRHPFGNTGRTGTVDNTAQPSSTGSDPTNPVTASGPANSFRADMAALEQALQSGSLASAQSAFSQLQQDLQSIQQGRGHHHHRQSTPGSQDPVSSYLANSVLGSTAATATGTGGSLQVSV